MRFSSATFSDIDFRDIQGLIRQGHGHLQEARYFLLNVRDPAAARAWLAEAPITTAVRLGLPETALQVAFTHDGLEKLGVPPRILGGFSNEFIVGMSGDQSRSRRLGDIGENQPAKWRWGGPGKVPHVLVMLFAKPQQLASREAEIKGLNWRSAFSELCLPLPTQDIGPIEPFGFVDGVSQPELDWERSKPRRLRDTLDYTNVAALGEFLLGYPNEYARYTDRPVLEPEEDPDRLLPLAEDQPGKRDFGRNGTYLVFRDLEQHVARFWQCIDALAGHDPARRQRLAYAMVGRSKTGDPIVPLRGKAIDGVAPEVEEAWLNQFTYENDPDGTACPFGAHIRRANPRNADLPSDARWPIRRLIRILGFGSRGPRDDFLSSTRFHRILRRGREYGPPLPAWQILGEPAPEGEEPGPPDAERGLRFIGLNANISRQFEFVQSAWIANARFDGLDETDPLLGDHEAESGGVFTRPQDNGLNSRIGGLSRFVTVRGGAYFFMPGISALRYIARIS